MPRVSPSQGTSKYKSGVQGGATRYADGVKNVKVSPAQKAIAQQDKMVQNWLESVNSGKWSQAMGEVSLTEWISVTSTKGATNYASSAEKGSMKYGQWAQTAYPTIQQIQDEVEAMPSTTLAENINRMIHNVTRMAELLG